VQLRCDDGRNTLQSFVRDETPMDVPVLRLLSSFFEEEQKCDA